ncbi:MAG TPA: aminotransferase class I/II-fold pyridoxal phosphate-dependent enzyme [Spirochaetota bacterium]|nr:aminotransferase class I/II-fold pyridoxal phosphate-dependent enzyme [Spirochaetota bacterium]HNT09323.1 aminotransferase class I/II-fold pyridoxal phosphate-dependent enzyme [Spirochaetota bacterium]
MKLSIVNTNDPESLVSAVGAAIPPSGIREFFDIVYSTPDCISLGVGEPDFITPWRVCETGIFAIRDGCTHYTSNRGLLELRELIAARIEKETGVGYDPETEIIVTMGVSQGLDIALRSIVNPGDEVIMFEPCYVSYMANVQLLHGVPVVLPTRLEDGFAIDAARVEQAIMPKTKAVLLNYPRNPTGSTIDRPTLERIARIAVERNIIVLADEIYSAIDYLDERFSINSVRGMRERTIYLNGFSKSHAMTGWRLGYVAGPKYLIDVILKIHQYTALCAPSIAQYAAIEGLKKGDGDVKRMRAEYLKRRNFMVSRFREIGLPCHNPEGAFYVFPSVKPAGLSSRDFALGLLKAEKVAVVPGEAFGPSGAGHIRCAYATSMENLTEAMKRIERYCTGLMK